MLKEKIEADFKQALIQRKEIELSILRMSKAEILNKEKEKRYALVKEEPNLSNQELEKKSILTDEEVLNVILSKIKKGREAVTEFEKGNRKDLVKREEAEIEVLKKYLPGQLSEKEIRKMVTAIIEKTKAESIKDMGRVMAELMPRIKGRAEGSLISKIVKELLT